MSDEPDRDLLAAEYVLGSLEGDERREAERLLADNPAFARSVATWQRRLTPLAAHVAPEVPPADLWGRIETAITPTSAVPLRRRVRFWQGATAGALAIAASLAAFLVLHRPEPPRVAVLSPIAGGAPVLIATAERNGELLVRPTAAITVPSDKDLELWALPLGETRPHTLGVLPSSGRQLAAQLSSNTQLLVSLEPKGGSPTGQPTGPVLYGGYLTSIEPPRG
ncbi:MAG TPA: anti-sigma factor [Acetobacteraceae bacterium]|jgi:anti-sigma-K factor RskA|nr:anti-sigma factor [Acetobacteraceae bacterium]